MDGNSVGKTWKNRVDGNNRCVNYCCPVRKTWSQRANPSLVFLLISLSVLVLAACQKEPPQLPSVDIPIQDIQDAIGYLEGEYDHEILLIRESPETAPNTYWLRTDNTLAVYALNAAGETEFAAKLCAEIRKYNPPRHGIIEALASEDIDWPPRTPITTTVTTETDTVTSTILYEQRTGSEMNDWEGYSDLALYGALDQLNEGNLSESRSIYRKAIEKFDGVGFADKVFATEQTYATYKLALAIYVGSRMGEPVDERLVTALLDKQQQPGGSFPLPGGFIALYDAEGRPLNDTNTETTSYALLALSSLQPNYNPTFSCRMPSQ